MFREVTVKNINATGQGQTQVFFHKGSDIDKEHKIPGIFAGLEKLEGAQII